MAYPNTLTVDEVVAMPDRRTYLGEATKYYYDACTRYGIDTKLAGIFAAQTIWEAGVPTNPSRVFRADSNCGGLKYNPSCPGATSGQRYPSSEGNGTYSHFQSVDAYYNAHVWTIATYYQECLSAGSVDAITDAITRKWVGTASYYEERDFCLQTYNQYNLGSCTGDGSWTPAAGGSAGAGGGGASTAAVAVTYETKSREYDTAKIIEGDGPDDWKTFYRFFMSSPAFIAQCLIPYAKSAKTYQAGYRLWFDDYSPVPESNSTIYFKPDNYYEYKDDSLLEDLDKHYVFDWGNGKDSNVISFDPSCSGILAAVTGGGEVEGEILDSIRNEIIRTTFNKDTDTLRPSTGEAIDYSESDTGLTIISASSSSIDELENMAASMWYNMKNVGYQAELVVVGDPEIEPQSICTVMVLTKEGLPHYSSGIYLITKVVDDITAGTFQSTLSLVRNAMEIGVDESGGLDIKLGQNTLYVGPQAGTGTTGGSTGMTGPVGEGVEAAVQWAINIANDDSHGYSQARREGPDYDCSSLTYHAFDQAGFGVIGDRGYAGTTFTMRHDFEPKGFTWHAGMGNSTDGLQRGDILLNESSHVEIYIGDGQMVGAHSSRGNSTPGDQPGNEVSVCPWRSHPWDGVLRYGG